MANREGAIVIRPVRFPSRREEEIYNRMREWDFTDSRILRQDKLNFPISELFIHTSLLFFLTLSYPFNSERVREFYANLFIGENRSKMVSRVDFRDVEITKEDMHTHLHIPILGPKAHDIAGNPTTNWTAMNLVLRNSNYNRHTSTVSGLTQNARIVQHVIRHTLLPKAGDRTNITPLISVVTYFCLTNTIFDVGDLLIRYIENIHSYSDARFKRKHNLCLGHIISYLIYSKYQIPLPAELDHQPIFFSNNSFNMLMGKGKGKRGVEEEEEEEEEGQEAAPAQGESSSAPPPPPPPAGGEDFTSQLGRIEGKLDRFINKYEEDRKSDRKWFAAQFGKFEQAASDDSD